MKPVDHRQADFVVIGCGIAGLRAAIELAAAGTVLVLSKAALTESATQYAQGGIAAALSDEDEIVLHLQDTLQAGDGLCNEAAVRIMVEEGPPYIQELIKWGTRFDRNGTRLAFTREGAHSRSRVLHAQGDSTGQEINRTLLARARSLKTIEFLPYVFTIDLLQDEGGAVRGVRYLDEIHHRVGEIIAPAVLLATGGLGQVFAETTNPIVATGDGIAIAYRAGAAVSDLEFVQFHPTALSVKGAPRFLLSEALRGEGGCLRNVELKRFMHHSHEAGDLAPRDVVSRAIAKELERTGSEFVYLDLTKLQADYVKKRFPRIYATCLEFNLDITSDLIPVRPAAHYSMGGVATDLDGRTTVPGLFAAGEVACTGVHGANRLASNSLLEGLVFGARASKAMTAGKKEAASSSRAKPMQAALGRSRPNPETTPAAPEPPVARRQAVQQIQKLMWDKAGLIRQGNELRAALEALAQLNHGLPTHPSRALYEEANLRIAAELIATSALAREESRGAHYRTDFPYRVDEQWSKHSRVRKGEAVRFV
jgi:L-aspartate oxidase